MHGVAKHGSLVDSDRCAKAIQVVDQAIQGQARDITDIRAVPSQLHKDESQMFS
jgi:hypothetical protein